MRLGTSSACRQSDGNFDNFHSAWSRQLGLPPSCKLSADAARNRATSSQTLALSLSHTLPAADWLSGWLYRVVCHTVCHIIWTITNHASVKQTKRVKRKAFASASVFAFTAAPAHGHPILHPLNENLQANPIFLQGVHSLVDRHREREIQREREERGAMADRAHHIWVLRAVRYFFGVPFSFLSHVKACVCVWECVREWIEEGAFKGSCYRAAAGAAAAAAVLHTSISF